MSSSRKQTLKMGPIPAVFIILGISFLVAPMFLLSSCEAAATAGNNTEPAANSTEASGQQEDQSKVKLGVYMESLCPDSRRFVVRQLLPAQHEIGPIMEAKLVPFGHARTLGGGKMICQHGPRECEGNRRMACIIARSKNQSEIIETIACIFKDEESLKSCLEHNYKPATFDEIESCTKADESYQMMVEAEKATGAVGYVPHLTVNDEFSDEIQDQAEHELKKLVCKRYKGSKQMEACKSALEEPTD